MKVIFFILISFFILLIYSSCKVASLASRIEEQLNN